MRRINVKVLGKESRMIIIVILIKIDTMLPIYWDGQLCSQKDPQSHIWICTSALHILSEYDSCQIA